MNKLVSGCMITKNEGEYLEYSIRSFIDYVDELIVVDDNSTDNTLEILRHIYKEKGKVFVVQGDYSGDKSWQRNEYLQRATGKWIFCPDGDEVYQPEQMRELRSIWEKEEHAVFIGFRLLNFWKDYRHVVVGPVWSSIMQRTFRNIPGIGYFDEHHSVSMTPGVIMARWAQREGKAIYLDHFHVPHYSYTKRATGVMKKIEYYMHRDNPNCKKNGDAALWARKHPYFSEAWNQPRYGKDGLYCCGQVDHQQERVQPYVGPHPEIMKKHPNWPLMHDYVIGMNRYMEEHWQYHNHLTHDKHQSRIMLAGRQCIGKTLEVGCANGFSTNTMYQSALRNSQDAYFLGVEPTDWGYENARRKYPSISFYKALGENLPFRDGEFDTVLQAEIIEHCADPRRLADEGWRVAKKRYVVTTPTQVHPDPDHKRFFSIEEMRKFLLPYGRMQLTGLTKTGHLAEDYQDIYFMIAWVDKS